MSIDAQNLGVGTAARAAAQPVALAPATPTHEYLSDLDTQLMLQLGAGQAEAASALVRRNLERVSRFVARIVRDPRAVEDLVQDVFVQVLSCAAKYTPTAKFSTWLYRIATNTALEYLRRAGSRRKLAGSSLVDIDLADADEPRPDHSLNLDELRGRLAASIDELPPNQRIALILFETEDFSYQQIAAVLSVSVDSVRALLLRARTALRQRLADVR